MRGSFLGVSRLRAASISAYTSGIPIAWRYPFMATISTSGGFGVEGFWRGSSPPAAEGSMRFAAMTCKTCLRSY